MSDECPVPLQESDDYATLAAWHSGFAYAETYRKVTLAHCAEAVRASCAAAGRRVSEARVQDLARLHPQYLDYLRRTLEGRIKWEREYRKHGGLA